MKQLTKIIHLLLILCWLVPQQSHSSPLVECLSDKMRRLFVQKGEGDKLYEALLNKRLSSASPQEFQQTLKTVLTAYSEHTPYFLKEDFLRWFNKSKNRFTQQELTAFYEKEIPFGKVMDDAYLRFEEANPSVKLANETAKAPQMIDEAIKACGKDKVCQESFFAKKMRGILKCVGSSPNPSDYYGAMFKSSAIMLASYGVFSAYDLDNILKWDFSNPKTEGYWKRFPYDLTIINLMWAPILAEMGCRNRIKQKVELKKSLSSWESKFAQSNSKALQDDVLAEFLKKDKLTLGKRIKNVGSAYKDYMKTGFYYWPMYYGAHTAQELAFGRDLGFCDEKKEDCNAKTYAKNFGKQIASYVLYDAAFAVPRMVFMTDPLFYKYVPALKNYLGDMTKNQAVKTGAKLSVDIVETAIARPAITVGSTAAFRWWEGFINHHGFGETPEKTKNADRTPGKSDEASQSDTSP